MTNTKKSYFFITATLLIILLTSTVLNGCTIRDNKNVGENNEFQENGKTTDVSEKDNNELTNTEENTSEHEDESENSFTPPPEGKFALDIAPAPGCSPYENNFTSEILVDGNVATDFLSNYEISFPNPEQYSDIPGITTFRGNNFRNTAGYGAVRVTEEKLEKIWSSKTGFINTWSIIGANGEPSLVPWTGVGWTGQAAVVEWPEETREMMNIFPEKKNKKNLKEVICAALDGNIYFLDLDDGEYTRQPIDFGFPIKGSVTVDPRGYPLLYVGQGLNENDHQKGPFGYWIYSLIDQKKLFFVDGMETTSFRRWGAFDSVGLVDASTDTLVICGENGMLYRIKLNTSFDKTNANISVSPEITKYRYQSPFGKKLGTEGSPVIYKNYIYFTDNGGVLQCVDLNTLEPVWIRDVTDDTDSTPVIEKVSESEVFLYTACEVDAQKEDGFSYIRKLNALNGELIWENKVKSYYDWYNNGGALASPVIGKGDIEDLIIFNVARTKTNGNGSKLLAYDKNTGDEVWVLDLDFYCWSSPVDVYTEDGKSYLLMCDSGGYMHLIDGELGEILYSLPLESNIEASPVVFNNTIVIGTRGQVIYGIKIK